MQDEEWRAIPSLPEYEASSLGRIRRRAYRAPVPHGGVRGYGGKAWAGSWDKKAKRRTFVFRRKTYKVARVVCEAFHGPPPSPKSVAMHLDENGDNNAQSNVAWGTSKGKPERSGFS